VINALRSEWIKLRTIRMNWVLFFIAAAFPLVIVVLVVSLSDIDELVAEDVIGLLTGTSVITAMLLGVIGASTITGEFGFGTIRVTFAAIPRRMVVLVAKAIITVLTALVVEAIVVTLGWFAASAIASGRDHPIDFGDSPSGTAPVVGVVAFAAIVALLGYGLGLLIRNTPAAVAILILWPLVAEGIVGAVLEGAGVEGAFKWMPYQSGINLGNPEIGSDGNGDSLGRVAGGLYFFGVTTVVSGIGAFLTRRRDA
jgi:ABC-2 type transport system permease protein